MQVSPQIQIYTLFKKVTLKKTTEDRHIASLSQALPKGFKVITFPSLIQTGESATLNLLAHTLFESPLDFSARRAVTTGQHFSRVEKIARPLDDLVRVRFVKIKDFILPPRLTFCDSDS